MEIIRDIEWKIRAKIVNPIVGKLQGIFGDYFRFLIDNENIHNLDELSYFFEGKKVAIVGNSPILENSGLGEQIDGYDIVIRFNRGILKLDRVNTGLKLDIYSTGMLDTLTSSGVRKQIEKTRENIKMLIPFPYEKSKGRKVGFNIAMLELLFPYKQHSKYYLPLDFYNDIYEQLGSEPSSGFVVIKYILECTNASNIGLFGFSFSSNNRIIGETYANQHDFFKEERIIRDLVRDNLKIELFQS